MSGRLPQSVHPGRLAESGATLRGSVPVGAMPRLQGFLHDTEGVVDVVLAFGIDGQKLRYVRVTLTTTLRLICQRCLQPIESPLRIETALGLVSSEEVAATLPGQYEPVVVEEGRLDIGKLVEDELLLALPIVPVHAPDDCGIDAAAAAPAADAPDASRGTRRPLAGLGELLREKERN